MEIASVSKIENYVAATIVVRAVFFLLYNLNKVYHKKWLRYASWACYLLVPILVVYTFGLMGESEKFNEHPTLYTNWGLILLFAYSGLDSPNCFRLNEMSSRFNLIFLYAAKSYLLFFFVRDLHFSNKMKCLMSVAVIYALIVMYLNLISRLRSMGHACGATPWIRKRAREKISNMNEEMDDDEMEVDPVNMKGIKYVVEVQKTEITVEKIWGCRGNILRSGDTDGRLKDTCLSFALFWLILGRFWGYPLYEGNRSKANAWKLVYGGLVAQGSAHERVFRIIEVELSFLQDYFYSNDLSYYHTGLLNRLDLSMLLPATISLISDLADAHADRYRYVFNVGAMLLVLYVLYVMKVASMTVSKWATVSLLCSYVDRETSNRKYSKNKLKVVGARCRISLFLDNKLFKPWKRNLDQYSLLESFTSWGIHRRRVGSFTSSFGFRLLEPGKRMGSSVVLCEDVKRAVVKSLCIDASGPKLSNGVASLRRNGVEGVFSRSCEPRKYGETILLWHVATGFCEMNPNSWQYRSHEHFKVAATLSRYCAYLLVFAPTLLPVPAIQAEFMCDTVIEETRKLFRDHRDDDGRSKYEKLKKHYRLGVDEEGHWDEGAATLLQKGVKLGEDLESAVEDEGRRWKILAEFWAEMILFLAPSNCNQMVHADKLGEGGEFITQLWALLIHAGVVDREDMVD